MGIDNDRLGQAQGLFRAARLAESEALFQQLVSSPSVGVEATAGIAMIKLRNGDHAGARQMFETVVRADAHESGLALADAFYGLGVIARKQNSNSEAAAHFKEAITVNPHHEGALNALATLPQIEKQAPIPIALRPGGPAASQEQDEQAGYAAFYVILGADKSPMSQEAIRVIDSLTMERRPRLSAYLVSVVAFVGILVLFVGGILVIVANQ
jgi:Tetratricopeptide repeat.